MFGYENEAQAAVDWEVYAELLEVLIEDVFGGAIPMNCRPRREGGEVTIAGGPHYLRDCGHSVEDIINKYRSVESRTVAP